MTKKNDLNIAYVLDMKTTENIGGLQVVYYHLTKLNANNVTIFDVNKYYPNWSKSRYYLSKVEKLSIINELSQCDVIVINGENLAENRGAVLIAELSININIPTFLINSTIETFGSTIDAFDNVLKKLNDLVVRDYNSLQFLLSKKIPARLCVDDFLNYKFSEEQTLDFGGKIILSDYDFALHAFITKALKIPFTDSKNINFYSFHNKNNPQSIISNYKSAQLALCGNHYSIYASVLAKIPFVVFPLSSINIVGLIKYSKIKIPYCTKPKHLENIIRYAVNNIEIFNDFRNFLTSLDKDSFSEIEKITNLLNCKVEIKKHFSILKLNAEIHKISYEKKLTSYESNNDVKKIMKLLDKFEYAQWLLQAPKVVNEEIFVNYPAFYYFISYYGVGNISAAKNIATKIGITENKIQNKIIVYFFLEIGIIDQHPKFSSIDLNDGEFSQLKYLYFLNERNYFEAWNILEKRPNSKYLIENNKHGYQASKNDFILIKLEGGLGDQIRDSSVLPALLDKYPNATVSCESRLISIFKRIYPNRAFASIDKDKENNYSYIYPIMDFFKYTSPFEKKNLIKPNKQLFTYWCDILAEVAASKKIIGICQGSSIRSCERIHNIFDFALWDSHINKYSDRFLFINLSFESKYRNDNFFYTSINLKDDIENVIALIANIDLIITPANSLLDICGALEKKIIVPYTGNKFNYRQQACGRDVFHRNTQWIGSKLLGEKSHVLELVFRHLDSLDL